MSAIDWNARYQSGDTPWEKGEPHPELPFLLSTHCDLFADAGAILVPGCGFGHDASLIGKIARGLTLGLDIAADPIAAADERYSARNLSFALGDLFEWKGLYDLVFEHTCFCAIPLDRRHDYAETMARLIPSGGHLIGIFFLATGCDDNEGPPFGTSLAELHHLFEEAFTLEWSRKPAKTFSSRTGSEEELAMIWKRR